MTGQQEWQPDDRAWCDGAMWRRSTQPEATPWTTTDERPDEDGWPVKWYARSDAEMTAAGAVLLVRGGKVVGADLIAEAMTFVKAWRKYEEHETPLLEAADRYAQLIGQGDRG